VPITFSLDKFLDPSIFYDQFYCNEKVTFECNVSTEIVDRATIFNQKRKEPERKKLQIKIKKKKNRNNVTKNFV